LLDRLIQTLPLGFSPEETHRVWLSGRLVSVTSYLHAMLAVGRWSNSQLRYMAHV